MRASLLLLGGIAIAGPATANPVITEVAWMGSDASANDEWIEIFNPDAQPVDASGFVLIEGGTAKALPAVTIPDLGFLVLERQATSTSLEAPVAQPFSFTSGLTNTGEPICLCPSGVTTCDVAQCDVANPGGAWFAGSNTVPKKTMERTDPSLPGNVASSWQDGSPSSPGALSPEVVDAGPSVDDAGPSNDDAGVIVVDAGPNEPPLVSMSAPSGNVSGGSVQVTYSASDPDEGDAVSVDLYWSPSDSGNDGVRFARGLPGGDNLSTSLDTTGIPQGTVHVFAAARDTRGAVSFAYAPGVVSVGGQGATATLTLTEPDGVNDAEDGEHVDIAWDLTLPAGGSGTVSLFLDDDDRGNDGEPIAGGLSAGPDGPRAYRLALSDLAPGEHHVYGLLEFVSPAGGGTVSSYADAAIQVPGPGCACTSGRESRAERLPAVACLAILLVTFARPRRRA